MRGKAANQPLRRADVVFQIAPLTGSGVLEAAVEAGMPSASTQPERVTASNVVTSCMKNGRCIYGVPHHREQHPTSPAH